MTRKMSDILNFDKLTAVKRIDSQEITSLHTSTFLCLNCFTKFLQKIVLWIPLKRNWISQTSIVAMHKQIKLGIVYFALPILISEYILVGYLVLLVLAERRHY